MREIFSLTRMAQMKHESAWKVMITKMNVRSRALNVISFIISELNNSLF